VVALCLVATDASQAALRQDVLDVFADHCILCHDAEDPPDDLRLDRWQDVEDAIARGVISPGDADASLLMRRILLPTSHDRAMPPEGAPTRPSDAEIAVLRDWIAGMEPAPAIGGGPVEAPAGRAPAASIQRLQAAGAHVGLVSQRATWLHIDVGRVAFPLAQAVRRDLEAIGPWVRELSVAGASGPVALAEIVSLTPNVRAIDAGRADLASLEGLGVAARLVSLNLTASSVTDEMLAAFRPNPRLAHVSLAHTSATADARDAFAAAFPNVALRATPTGASDEAIAWSDDQRAVWRVSDSVWSAFARSAWDTVAASAHESWIGTLANGVAVSSVDAWRAVEEAAEATPSVVVRHTPLRVRVVGDAAAVHSLLTRVPPVALPDARRSTVFLTETYARTEDGWKCLTAAITNTLDAETP